ncbi:MAG TPA: AbrB/MazE/SpoVT family DNA-binding domain-containing protein [Scandinavium sp.]|jgi:antitoxin ChpS|uniref:AbrB/MazE/SpoVT family DNA-binding domain-containing protein n=1 Tax=Scandinavium sp. TaxID=2830653 RepID=UPI002E374142|nr:AbrB/MazE/SpoVT family DNA-binding domain-containing protein [Scandinavium sp.]HEX4503071.1 AbrB/MazE/SpoVT family DNA-binding domain-containing protein [Scandinavium sp.]
MRIIIKKWGNSTGMVIPGVVVKALGLTVGQSMEAEVKNNQFILTPVSKKYSLDELLAQCDPNAPEISENEIWGEDNPQGREQW